MTAGSICLLLTAALHTMAHFSPLPDDPQLLKVVDAMQAHQIDAGFGMHPTVVDIQRSMSLAMSVFLAAIGIGNLVVLNQASIPPSLVRNLAGVNAISMATLACVYYVHSFPQPLMNFAVLAVLFLIALLLPQGAATSGHTTADL